jgi:hypothetical protein
MLTRKQEQGLRILESIVQSEYPFVVSLTIADNKLDAWPTMINVTLEIDPITLSNFIDIPFANKFKEKHMWDFYSGDNSEMSYLVHLFPDEYSGEMGWKFNHMMDDFMTKAYSQLPVNMRINVYNTSPEDEIPGWALSRSTSPRTINTERFYIAKDSKRPTRFED